MLLAFVGSNAIAHESGLLALTIMGIAQGHMRGVHVDDIFDFEENLTTLPVSLLFILLAARLPWPLPGHLLWEGLAISLSAQLVVQPLTVRVASPGSWVAPHGTTPTLFLAPPCGENTWMCSALGSEESRAIHGPSPRPDGGGRKRVAAGDRNCFETCGTGCPPPTLHTGLGGGGRPRYATAVRWNCASSVEPFSAVVDDWPCWIAWVTASK